LLRTWFTVPPGGGRIDRDNLTPTIRRLSTE